MDLVLLRRLVLSLVGLGLLVADVYRHYRADIARAYDRVADGGQVVETACGLVQYTEFGSGAPVLMIHGAGGGYDQGAYFAQLLGGGYRWIAPSRFGYLGTPVPEDASSELQADAYACLLNALDIDRVGVVGVSGGGPSALLFALRHADRTTGLVMIDAVSHSMPVRPAYLNTLFSVFTNDFIFWSLTHISKGGLLAALGVPKADQKQLSAADLNEAYAFLDTILPMKPRRAGQVLEQSMSEYNAAEIGQIGVPTLVVHARNDTLVGFDQGSYTAEMVTGAQFISMETGGHLAIMFGANAGGLNSVRQFLGKRNSF